MANELTEEEKTIVDYVKENGYKNGAEHFSITYGRVLYLMRKNKLINEKKEESQGFVKISLSNTISFRIGNSQIIQMEVSDFKKVFGI